MNCYGQGTMHHDRSYFQRHPLQYDPFHMLFLIKDLFICKDILFWLCGSSLLHAGFFIAVCRLLVTVASLVVEHRL